MIEPVSGSPSPTAVPSSGRIVGVDHLLALRVYFEDTDAAGMVYHANYLRYMERGRSDLLRHAGIVQSRTMARKGDGFIGFVVRRCVIDFLKPARLDDALEVVTRVVRTGGAAVDLVQSVRRDSAELARAQVRVACIGGNGRPRRLPRDVRAGFLALTAPPAN